MEEMRKREQAELKTPGRASEAGQALIEYVLLIAITLSLVTLLANGLRRSVFSLWTFYAKTVSAPCPGCPSPNNID
jgi:Flp pilus assembly pilin Flp